MPSIQRNQEPRPSIDRRLQHHVIVWIRQSRTPEKREANRLSDPRDRIQEDSAILSTETRSVEMLRSR